MKKSTVFQGLTLSLTLSLAACSSSDDPEEAAQLEFNPNAPEAVDDGEPGGDITAIAGLWDGSVVMDETTDVVYWHLAADGVLTRYDFQQDGLAGASGENCYVVGDPITVSPESDDTYSFFNVAVTAVRNEQSLTITFIDPDINDVDKDGDTTETPTFTWSLLTTPSLEDLNSCITSAEDSGLAIASDQQASGVGTVSPEDDVADMEPLLGDETTEGGELSVDTPVISFEMSRAECENMEGGTVVGDIGDGAIFSPDYRCESGLRPVGLIIAIDDEPIAVDGEVCCV